MKKGVLCLIGPTAVGKTEVAIYLARKLGAEIISCDSMQVYKGINIACAKPTKRQLEAVPHHLISVISPTQKYNAASFRCQALGLIKEIHQRQKLPLIVAGTGLYLRALLDGLFEGPGQDPALRQELYQLAEERGCALLYAQLQAVDEAASKKIHPHDLRRIVRALEVYEKTKLPISQWKNKTIGIRGQYTIRIFGLRRKRDQLYGRIEKRVEQMFRRGLVAEIKQLRKLRLSQSATSLLGYKEIDGFLEGRYSRAEAEELLKRNTRRYAKRQLSWFKREKGVEWIDVGLNDSPTLVAEKIVKQLTD